MGDNRHRIRGSRVNDVMARGCSRLRLPMLKNIRYHHSFILHAIKLYDEDVDRYKYWNFVILFTLLTIMTRLNVMLVYKFVCIAMFVVYAMFRH